MDKFDDLPDLIEKDTKPKFQTEIHKTIGKDGNGAAGHISNGLEPLFDEESTVDQQHVQDHQVAAQLQPQSKDAEEGAELIQQPANHDK